MGLRWTLSDVLDLELAADLGVARLDGGGVRFAPLLTLGLGLTP